MKVNVKIGEIKFILYCLILMNSVQPNKIYKKYNKRIKFKLITAKNK